MIPFIQNFWKEVKTIEKEDRSVFAWAANGHEGTFWNVESDLKLDCSDRYELCKFSGHH